MTKLRALMMQDLELGGYAETTRGHYLRSIAQFAKFHRRSPAELHQPEVRQWVQHLMGQGLSTQRLRQHFAALRFLYGKTLGRPAETAFLSWPQDADKLPVVLSGSASITGRCSNRRPHHASPTRRRCRPPISTRWSRRHVGGTDAVLSPDAPVSAPPPRRLRSRTPASGARGA